MHMTLQPMSLQCGISIRAATAELGVYDGHISAYYLLSYLGCASRWGIPSSLSTSVR